MHKRVFWIFLVIASSIDVEGQNKEASVGDYCVVKYTFEKGHCQQFQDCPTAKKDLKNGFTTTYCSGADDMGRLLVCCRDSSLDVDGIGLKIGEDSADKPKRISDKKCEEYGRQLNKSTPAVALLVNPVTIPTEDSLCKFVGMALIVGGDKAQVEEYPHMAAIFYRDADTYHFMCTGSLISEKFVMTAGHCNQSTVPGKDPQPASLVRLGDLNIAQKPANGAQRMDIPIRKIHTHPDYFPPRVYNDIALLELDRTVTFTPALRPACLWTQNGVGTFVKGIATGWGITNPQRPKPSEVLMKVSVPFRENNFCDDKLFNERQEQRWDGFTETQLCAGDLEGGRDTCEGDSGGPIQVTSRDNKCMHYVVGVTSVGKGCGEKDLPSIYTRVSSYLDWIEGIVWPDGNEA